MLIEIDYAVGDKVQYIQYSGEIERHECSFCVGTGNISGHDGTSADCPKCGGTGIIEEDNRERIESYGTVQDISVKWRRNDNSPMVNPPEINYLVDDQWVAKSDIKGRFYES